MKNIALLLITVVLGVIIISAALVLPRPPVDSVAASEWTDVYHGAVVFISLATDAKWITNHTYKITFLFSVKNISGSTNATTYYNNSHIILNSIKLDPSYINMSESPFKKLSEKQGWSVDWYFTPKADDFTVACLGISQGKHIKYPLSMEVNYTVIDSNGVEWPALFQRISPEPSLIVTIVGGEDAP